MPKLFTLRQGQKLVVMLSMAVEYFMVTGCPDQVDPIVAFFNDKITTRDHCVRSGNVGLLLAEHSSVSVQVGLRRIKLQS